MPSSSRFGLLRRIAPCVLGIGLLAGSLSGQQPSVPPPPTTARIVPEPAFNLPSLLAVVRPMEHDPIGRLPVLLWSWPIQRGPTLVRARFTGALRGAVDQVGNRGLAPTVELGWDWTPAGAMALAQTLQDAGRPVHLLIPREDLIEATVYRDCPVWAEGPDASHPGRARRWPCLALADTKAGAAYVRQQLEPFKKAGIRVGAVWFDDEGLPYPWNGIFEAQTTSAECRKHYPPGVLDDFGKFKQYAQDLRAKVLSEVMADPVHELFPGAIAGTFGDYASSAATPYVDSNGNPYPPRDPGRMDVLMPAAYAMTGLLGKALDPDKPMTQDRADRYYLSLLLRTVSSCNANKPKGKLSVPFVSRAVRDNPDPRVAFAMTRGVFRETVRHLWLRGCDGMYVFNQGGPGSGITPAAAFASVEDVRATHDEWLAYPDFLKAGEPLNYGWPDSDGPAVLWSGLRLKDRALVRVAALGAESMKIEVKPFDTIAVTLDAPADGATYLIDAAGRAERVAVGR